MNRLRSWRVEIAEDLLGVWHARVTFGRIGYPGRTVSRHFENARDLHRFVRRALRRRGTARRRLGVAYEAVEASANARPLLAEVGLPFKGDNRTPHGKLRIPHGEPHAGPPTPSD